MSEDASLLDVLTAERDFARQVMESMGQGLALFDRDFRFTFVNAALANLLQYTPEDLLGRTPWDFVHADDHPKVRDGVLERQERKSTSYEARLVRRDGEVVHVLLTASPAEQAGKRSSTICVITDLTERRAVEQVLARSESLYRALAANFPQGALILFDHDLRYTLVDGQGLAAVGLTKETMEGRTVYEVMRPPLSDLIAADYRAALAGRHVSRELTFARHHYLVHALPVRDDAGHVLAGLVMTLDITERKRAEDELARAKATAERSAAYARALVDVSKLVLSDLDIDDAARHAIRTVARAAMVDWAGLVVFRDGKTVTTTLTAGEGAGPVLAALLERPSLRNSPSVWTMLEGRDVLYEDDYATHPEAHPVLIRRGVRSVAWVPMARHGSTTYALAAARVTSGPWSSEVRDLFESAARSVQAAFTHQAHTRSMAEAALLDTLTGLGNRRAFDLDLEVAIASALRHGHPVGLIMLDLDGLKRVNDTEGHQRGDELLATFSRALRAVLRREDRAYRLGGDEFAVILDHADPLGAPGLLERVNAAVHHVRERGFPNAQVSAGVAFYSSESRTARDLVRLADDRMYLQKRQRKARAARDGLGGTEYVTPNA